MKYKITNIDTKNKVVSLTVTFDDNSTYDKRMMADVSSEETIHAGIKQWLADYLEAKAEESTFDPKGLVNKTTDVQKADLPKTSRLQARDEESKKSAERVKKNG